VSVDKQIYDDQLLIQYILGALADEEAERLDELSIADNEFAARLSAIENDLVDAYARGELSGSTLEQFKSSYLSSVERRQKVMFAEALCSYAHGSRSVLVTVASEAVYSGDKAPSLPQKRSRRYLAMPRLSVQWGFAGAALLMAFVAGYLLVSKVRLQNQLTHAQSEKTALEQREQQLQKQLKGLPSSTEQPQVDQTKIVSLLLAPPTRSWGRIATVVVPQGTTGVNVRLQLESDDFAVYKVVVRDPASDRILWRSQALKATSDGESKAVSFGLPASLLRPQNYVLELSGVSPGGSAEFISSYPFRVVIK
jgi:anti-sigma-K factor RskA